MRGWLDERLDITRLRRKYFLKVFPVHYSFFLGEIALVAFVILVVTGIFLAVNYEPSMRIVQLDGQAVPAAYASVVHIDTLPFGQVIRSTHHWSAHIFIAAAFLHLLRHLLTGSYKKPREINWWVGATMLVLGVVTAFTGYALPSDAFAVVATKIGYGIAGAIPWIGGWIANVLFGGDYPTVYSLNRLYPAHILFMPVLIIGVLTVHLLFVVKQLHTQPAYAERVAPGKVLGVPMVPSQALMVSTLVFIYLAVVVAIAGAVDVHPVQAFGPPGEMTPPVRPDWYFLWVYGVLELIPSRWRLILLGGSFGPELWGGVIVPGVVALAIFAVPLLDRSRSRVRYLELPSRHPLRTGLTMGMLGFFIVASVAGFHDALGVPTWVFRVLLFTVPAVVAAGTYGLIRLLFGPHALPRVARSRT
jgi:cytochrome b-561